MDERLWPNLLNWVKVTNKSKKSIHIDKNITPYRKLIGIKYEKMHTKRVKNIKSLQKVNFLTIAISTEKEYD